ncbi:hypothetical protein EVAR_44101_1 [Eumeta japonica]|uniref:Uncharacterized protein n=1 Tax=Eumeta variegata TaxID=151549 RepID=A0A4C1X293_EUMVA|nr:hypothetical protein EVAR_44101_1 [Eumeta japonica]
MLISVAIRTYTIESLHTCSGASVTDAPEHVCNDSSVRPTVGTAAQAHPARSPTIYTYVRRGRSPVRRQLLHTRSPRGGRRGRRRG